VGVASGRSRRRNDRDDVVQSFYHAALSEAERDDLPLAREVPGVDEEIAVLRLRLRSALQEHPEDLPLMLKGIELLVRALSASYRLSKDAKADLSASLRGVLEEVGGRIYPEGLGDIPRDGGARRVGPARAAATPPSTPSSKSACATSRSSSTS
jgi:hypothetical protein